jgi:hypothetical protein
MSSASAQFREQAFLAAMERGFQIWMEQTFRIRVEQGFRNWVQQGFSPAVKALLVAALAAGGHLKTSGAKAPVHELAFNAALNRCSTLRNSSR